ncbi:MAG: hypothetical protein HC929_16195 [Leptolyngbyaceae cyanobacterium SM2_5_2]|nr:hypothetical protein [Leptolyngbyaceae cyanobacterium SM2_5_2]
MNAITTTATKAVAQLFEVAAAIQAAEIAAVAADPTFEPLLTIATDAEGQTMTVALTVTATVSGTGGQVLFTPVDYLA